MAAVKFAVIDVNDFLSKKQSSEPELASDWAKLEELYNKKWVRPLFTVITDYFYLINNYNLTSLFFTDYGTNLL